MKYMLLIFNDEAKMKAVPKDDVNKMLPAYTAYTEAMKTAGILRGGERLQYGSNATTVRVTDGKTKVLNGPYIEAKEYIGSFTIVDVDSEERALEIAAQNPASRFTQIEVRPILHEAPTEL